MQSNNPVFRRSEGFNSQAAGYPGMATQQPGYAGFEPGGTGYAVQQDRMTIDTVVQKTGLSILVVVAAAAATWIFSGDVINDESKLGLLYGLTMGGMFIGLGLSLWMSFKQQAVSPALVLAYSAAEGVFLGGVSKITEQFVAEGVVMAAVIGTFCAAGALLAVYRFFDVQVGNKFRKFAAAAFLGFFALSMVELVLSFIGSPIGLFQNGGLGLLFASVGLVLGLVGLILDFDFVERGVAAGLPENYSWTAAFGLVASLVMVYFYLLRILTILNQD